MGSIAWGLLLPKAAAGVLALLCANAFIVGINQIYDVEVDVINKPFLPVAAGEMSKNVAWLTITSLACVGLVIVFRQFDATLAYLYAASLAIGVAYSVPPVRLKTRPLAAMISIALCRGFLLNFGVHSAAANALGFPFEWRLPVLFITIFVTCFSVIIAATKDLADVKGDRINAITTFATMVGVDKVSRAAAGLLMANYAGAVVLGITQTETFSSFVMVVSHFVLAVALTVNVCRLHYRDTYSDQGTKVFYRALWNLFYAEYLIYPFI